MPKPLQRVVFLLSSRKFRFRIIIGLITFFAGMSAYLGFIAPTAHGQTVGNVDLSNLTSPELPVANANTSVTPDQNYLGQVTQITKEGMTDLDGTPQPFQDLTVKLLNGPQKGTFVNFEYGGKITVENYQKVKVGQKIVLLVTQGDSGPQYFIADNYRIPSLWLLGIAFFILIVVLARWRGFTSVLGLVVSVFVLGAYIVPHILSGSNPLVVSILGAAGIAIVSLYLAHGFNYRTTLALVSTLITLGVAVLLSIIAVHLANLSGYGSEEVFYLQYGDTATLNLQGLLLGGIIIGTLGILDDITTGQAAAVDEIHRANPALPFSELYKRGTSVGREHIASLVNTLVLAYAGTSFPLLLLITLNKSVPLWVTLNGEYAAEEIVRTIVGSMALVLGVPIATSIAAYFIAKRKVRSGEQPAGNYHHH